MRSPFEVDITANNFDNDHVNMAVLKDEKAVKELMVKLNDLEVQKLFNGYYYNEKEEATKPI